MSTAALALQAVTQFACPTCDEPAGSPCLSVAAKPQDAAGRLHDKPFALRLPHRPRMALRKAAHALTLADLEPVDLLRFGA